MNTTKIYYTDGAVGENINRLVRKRLVAANKPIISISQKPIGFGTNICVGEIGRSYESIQRQVLAGLEAATTQYIALAEHDTLYPEGYFDWTPPREDTFYYNSNRVFVVAKKGPQYGMYITFKDSHPNADQLICNRELLIGATKRRVDLLAKKADIPVGWGEPGYAFDDEEIGWRETDVPSVDILHNNNFTSRYGLIDKEHCCYELQCWGKFEEIK